MAEAPLSALCGICYTNIPKYRCPRCPGPVRTCSLPCYKRHQQRASCNGQRDPAAYIPKSQLATPAGIDHDYNFLTKVEGAVGHADIAHDERTGTTRAASGGAKNRWNNDGPLQRYLREHRILVDRAPIGMSRQKANHTRWLQKSKRIVWTAEWIDVDGHKRLSEVYEGHALGEAYATMLNEREREGKKRKRDSDPNEISSTDAQKSAHGEKKGLDAEDPDNQGSGSSKREDQPKNETSQLRRATSSKDTVTPPVKGSDIQSESAPSTGNTYNHAATGEPSSRTHPTLDDDAKEPATPLAPPSSVHVKTPYLYLLKPHTTSTSSVLIPLSASDTLTACLQHQIVLEFPTFYALTESPDSLPPQYTTERTYLETKRREDIELETLLGATVGPKRIKLDGGIFGSPSGDTTTAGTGANTTTRRDEAEWDERQILEMLKRDVKA